MPPPIQTPPRFKLAARLLTAAVLTACSDDGVGPQQGSLRLEAAIGRSSIRFGDTTSLLFRLRNLSTDSVTLTFANSCQILPYITTRRGGHMVYPSGGAWGCYQAFTSLTVAPRDQRAISVLIHAGAERMGAAVALLPGEYLAYARLEHPVVNLRSETVSLIVR